MSGTLIQGATRKINQTAVDFGNAVIDELQDSMLKVELGLSSELANKISALLFGAAPSVSVGLSGLNQSIAELKEFKGKVEGFFDAYRSALDNAQSGDICRQWDAVTFVGKRAVEVIPGF